MFSGPNLSVLLGSHESKPPGWCRVVASCSCPGERRAPASPQTVNFTGKPQVSGLTSLAGGCWAGPHLPLFCLLAPLTLSLKEKPVEAATALLSGSAEVWIKREAAPSGMSPLSGPGGPERAREPGAVCDGGSPASPGDLPRAKAVSQTLPGETEWGNCSPQSGCQVSFARRHEGQSGSESWPGLWDAIS